MGERTTVVRICKKIGHHNPYRATRKPGVTSASLSGKTIRIHLPPERPDANWTCDTEWVWRVHAESVAQLVECAGNPDRVFVCEHSIELD